LPGRSTLRALELNKVEGTLNPRLSNLQYFLTPCLLGPPVYLTLEGIHVFKSGKWDVLLGVFQKAQGSRNFNLYALNLAVPF